MEYRIIYPNDLKFYENVSNENVSFLKHVTYTDLSFARLNNGFLMQEMDKK